MDSRCAPATHDADETGRMLADSADDFFQRQPASLGRAPTRAAWQALAEQGWLALRLPEAQGGSELLARHGAVIAEALGRALWPEPFALHAVMVSALVRRLDETGSDAWSGIVQSLLDGRHVLACAWQDQPQQTDAALPACVAAPGDTGLRLRGRKFGLAAVDLADALLVTAALNGQTALFEVPLGSPGLVRHDSGTSDGGTVSVVDFHNVAVASPLARGPAVSQALQAALDEAVLMAAVQLYGVGDAALQTTLEHLRTREQFGRPIGSFQAPQHACVDTGVQLMLARAACRRALDAHAEDAGARPTRAAISAAKARASDAALSACRLGVQLHGAMGYTAESRIGQCMKAALRLSAALGPAGAHRRRFMALEEYDG